MPNDPVSSTMLHNNEGFLCDAVEFDGTDGLSLGAGLTGAVDSKKGIFCLYFKRASAPSGDQRIFAGRAFANSVLVPFIYNTGKLSVVLRAANFDPVLDMHTDDLGIDVWWRLLCSWDLAVPGAAHIYVTDALNVTVNTFVNDFIDYTLEDWAVGMDPFGGSNFYGAMAELYFNDAEYLDFSVAANRRKFSGANGKPVFLGTDGSVPTGTAPIVYLHLDKGEAPANFATNRGTGGNFSIAGTLTTASTSPSD